MRETIKEQLAKSSIIGGIFDNPYFIVYAEKMLNSGAFFAFENGRIFLFKKNDFYIKSGLRSFTQVGFKEVDANIDGAYKKYFVIEEVNERRRASMKRLVNATFPFSKQLTTSIKYYNEFGVLKYKEEIYVSGKTVYQGGEKHFDAFLAPFTSYTDFFKLNRYDINGLLEQSKLIYDITNKITYRRLINPDNVEVQIFNKNKYITTRHIITGRDLNNFEYNEIKERSFKELVTNDKYLKTIYNEKDSSIDINNMPMEEKIIYTDLLKRFGEAR